MSSMPTTGSYNTGLLKESTAMKVKEAVTPATARVSPVPTAEENLVSALRDTTEKVNWGTAMATPFTWMLNTSNDPTCRYSGTVQAQGGG